MRYIIYGAGAVGGVIGARLFQSGCDVILIARGAHGDAIRRGGLTFKSSETTLQLQISVAGNPSEVGLSADDVVILAMKSQDTSAALNELRDAGGEKLPIFCAQNGVVNERLALRRFDRVYGVLVILPASHMEPGVVGASAANKTGILDLGCYTGGADSLAQAVADDLNAADFSAHVREEIMRWKYAKLISNLGNALQAACGLEADIRDIFLRLRDEALACYEAASIDCASDEEMLARREGVVSFRAVGGLQRRGGSSWQSIARGAGSIETDYLNGEIALLGNLHGVPTPANRAVQRIAVRLVREEMAPGSIAPDEIRQEVERAEG